MTDSNMLAVRDKLGRVAPFQPTGTQREQVRSLAGIGCTNDEIRSVVAWGRRRPIDAKTLMKHFAQEIEAGRAIARSRAKRTLYEMAVGERNLGALIFFLKTQCGWKESSAIEVAGADGKALSSGVVIVLPAKAVLPTLTAPD